MCRLIKYEFMKLYKKKMNLIIFWGTCILMAFFMILSVKQTWSYDKEGKQISGFEFIKYRKETMKELEGPLTDEKVKKLLTEYQEIASKPGNYEGEGDDWHLVEEVYLSYYLPKRNLLTTIAHTYDAPGVQTWGANLREIKLDEVDGFYQTRTERLRGTLEMGSSDWQYHKAEQEFWMKKCERIKTPFQYGYAEGWQRMLDVLGLLSIPLISLLIMTATVYAGEYEKNTDHVILTTKYGKSKLIAAKNIAAFLFGGLFYTVNIVICLLIILSSFGMEGWNLPIQNLEGQIPYPFTHLEAVLICIGITYIVVFGMIAFTLFLSARMKNGLPVLAVTLFIFFIALFLKSSDTNGIYNHILFLLPFNAMDHGLQSLTSYPFGKVVFDYMGMRYIVYLLLMAILLPFAGRAFKKHQVQ